MAGRKSSVWRRNPSPKFYGEVMSALRELDLPVEINTTPNEVDPAIPFEQNEKNSVL